MTRIERWLEPMNADGVHTGHAPGLCSGGLALLGCGHGFAGAGGGNYIVLEADGVSRLELEASTDDLILE